MANYTSEYSGTQIDEAVFFGYTAKNVGNTFVSQNIVNWTGNAAPYTYVYNSTVAFSYRPLVFFVDANGNRIDLDYKVDAGLKTITVSSNAKLALTMIICG